VSASKRVSCQQEGLASIKYHLFTVFLCGFSTSTLFPGTHLKNVKLSAWRDMAWFGISYSTELIANDMESLVEQQMVSFAALHKDWSTSYNSLLICQVKPRWIESWDMTDLRHSTYGSELVNENESTWCIIIEGSDGVLRLCHAWWMMIVAHCIIGEISQEERLIQLSYAVLRAGEC